MSFEAYSVAINLKVEDQFSNSLGQLTDKLRESSKHTEELQKNLSGLSAAFGATSAASARGRRALLDTAQDVSKVTKVFAKSQKAWDKLKETYATGGKLSGVGAGMQAFLKEATGEALKLEQQLNKLKAMKFDARFGAGTTDALQKQAAAIAKNTAGTTGTDALRAVTEAQAITGDLKQSEAFAPLIAQLHFGIESYTTGQGQQSGKGEEAERQFTEILLKMKNAGLTAGFTSDKYQQLANLYTQDYIASNGRVKASEFIEMAKSTKAANANVNVNGAMTLSDLVKQEQDSTAGKQVDMKAKVARLEEEFGTAALPALKRMLETAIPLAKSLSEWMENHPDALAFIARGFGLVAGALAFGGPLLVVGSLLKKLNTGITGFATALIQSRFVRLISIGALNVVGLALNALGSAMLFVARAMIANPVGMIMIALGTAAYLLWRNWSTLWPQFKALWGNIKTGWAAFLDWFHQKWEAFKSHLPGFLVGNTPAPEPEQHPTVRPHSVAKINQNGDVYLDGKKVGKVIAPHVSNEQARAAARPTGGTTGYDPRMAPAPVGAA